MQSILNYTPQVYEAIIAAFALLSVISIFALVRKSKQVAALKEATKAGVTEAMKIIFTNAMQSSLRVAAANARTRKVGEAADEAINAATALIESQQERIDELEAEDDRIDDLEQRLDDLEAPAQAGEENVGERSHVISLPRFPFDAPGFPFGPAGFPFGPGKSDPLSALLASIGRNAGARRAPSVQAFKITPDGLVPVRGPADFLGGTFNRETPGARRPNAADILALLSGIVPPRPGQWAGPDSVKADLTPVNAGVEGSLAETEACDTQRAPVGNTYEQTHTAGGDRCAAGDPAAIDTRKTLSPANDPGARAPYDHHASKLTNGDGSPRRPLPEGFPGLGLPSSPRAG